MTTDAAVMSLVITTGFTFLGTISTMLYQGWSSGRQRRWDIEDQDRKLKIAMVTATEKLTEHTETVVAKIEETKVVAQQGVKAAQEAYTESNHVNLKIEKLNQESVATNKRAEKTEQQAGERLDGIGAVGQDTNAIVRDLAKRPPSGD